MLSAHCLMEDRLKALSLGTDDYLTKPFIIRELVLRATALARRIPAAPAPAPEPQLSRCGAIEFDPRSLEVRVSGTPIELRPRELRLLQVLMERPDAVFTRKYLLQRVWDNSVPASSRVVDVTISRLRSALGQRAVVLETVFDGGYRLRTSAPA
jgi:DNA-binding response OmpR family regulator